MNSAPVLTGLLLSSGLSLWLSASSEGPLSVGASRVNEVTTSSRPESSWGTFPERVVSASLLSDELLEGVLPWRRWAGVSYVVDWASSTPASAAFPAHLRRTSGTAEDVVSLRPDLVVISSYNDALTGLQLRSMGAPVHVVQAEPTFHKLFLAWGELGKRVGAQQAAAAAIQRARTELHSIQRLGLGSARRRALLLQGTFSYGGTSLQGDCLRQAGLKNVLEEERWGANPQINAEHLLHLDPEIIFVASDVATPLPLRPAELPVGYPWHVLTATKNHRVFAIPTAWMSSISHHALLACRAYAEAKNRAFESKKPRLHAAASRKGKR